MKNFFVGFAASVALSACASTSIQDMSRNTFQVSTTTAPICGKSGASKVSSKVAAIEVIRRGGDRFVIESAQSSRSLSGIVGLTAVNRSNQGIVVRMVELGDEAYDDALSAREVLGEDWEKQAKRGKPSTC